jgi:GcrA cell cycle regulator
MQATNWAPQHCDALRDYLAKGMSYSQAADAINAKFGTAYTRNAAIGRGRRMGLAGPERPKEPRRVPSRTSAPRPRRSRKRRAAGPVQPKPVQPNQPAQSNKLGQPDKPVQPKPELVCAEPVKLRCVGIKPRLISLVDLEAGDCRYPYGGDRDGEAITFCGHPRREGSSYCTAHFDLTRGPSTEAERSAGPVVLRLVQAA